MIGLCLRIGLIKWKLFKDEWNGSVINFENYPSNKDRKEYDPTLFKGSSFPSVILIFSFILVNINSYNTGSYQLVIKAAPNQLPAPNQWYPFSHLFSVTPTVKKLENDENQLKDSIGDIRRFLAN